MLLHDSTVDDVEEDFFPYRDYEVRISYDPVNDDQIADEFMSIDDLLFNAAVDAETVVLVDHVVADGQVAYAADTGTAL